MSTPGRGSKWAPTLPPGAVVGRANQNTLLDEIMADPELSGTTKNVAWAVNKHLNGVSGWTFTGNNGIARDLAMDRPNAIKHLAALEGGERPANRNAPRRSKCYVYSIKFGPHGHERVYRCFLQPEWLTSGDAPPGDASQTAT